MSVRLSIVIPSHNRPDLLRTCLTSVIRHAPPGTEVLVVDDGSEAAIVSRTAAAHPGVRTLRLPRQRGFCVAANAGIQAASHPVIELLNDDAEVTAGWAAAALAHFDDPSVAAVAPLVLQAPLAPSSVGGEEGKPSSARVTIDSAGDRYFIGGVAGKRGHGQRLGSFPLRARRVFGASASSAFYRHEVLLRVGAFPEEFGAYFEDVDLAFRLHRAGYAVTFEPTSCVLHRMGASHRRHRRLLEQQSRNEELVFWRNLPGAALWRALPLHIAVLLGKAWLRGGEDGLVPFVLGRLRVLGELPALLRHRRWLRSLGAGTDLNRWGVDSGWLGTADGSVEGDSQPSSTSSATSCVSNADVRWSGHQTQHGAVRVDRPALRRC